MMGMTRLFSILALGFFLGMRHATDADHVVAITTIVSRERSVRSAALLGGLWGLGHTMTILLVGGAIIGFHLVVPPRIGLSLELAVALMLVLLGALNLTGAFDRVDALAHDHSPNENPPFSTTRMVRSLAIGVVHGLAGSAAVALLVLTAIRDARWAGAYLLIFGFGTVAGMMVLTVMMVAPLAYATRAMKTLPRVMARATGLLSLGFGLYLAYRIGFVDGLFTGSPRWTPE